VWALPPDKQGEEIGAELKRRNPAFDGKVTPEIKDGVVTGLQFATNNVTDLSPVRALPGLRRLECWGNPDKGKLADLMPLKGMLLNQLMCYETQVSDLTPLKGMPLLLLNCQHTKVSDLSPLKDMKLEALGCGSTQVSDLAPLKDMKLTSLGCSGTRVSDLTPLKDMKLTYLECHRTQVSDLSPLKGMPLTTLFVDFKPERDAEVLRSIKTLENINGEPPAEFWKKVDGAGKP
jgi:Leucine-rich repeat (LRR) protein